MLLHRVLMEVSVLKLENPATNAHVQLNIMEEDVRKKVKYFELSTQYSWTK